MTDRRAGALVTILLPWLGLAVVPGLAAPFSTPKTWGLLAAAAVGGGVLLGRPPRDAPGTPRVLVALAVAWGACAALSTFTGGAAQPAALLRILAAAVLLLALLAAPPDPRLVLRAAAATGAAVSGVVLLQAARWDPFAAAGLVPAVAGDRMRLYGTLGNPDFVAGFLAATACATAGLLARGPGGASRAPAGDGSASARRLRLAAVLGALALELGALGRLGSLATLLSALGALAVVAIGGGARVRRLGLAVGVVALVVVGVGARHRAAARAVDGRRYLWSVAAPHLADAPWLGHGPGAFAALWPGWEAAFWRAHPSSTARAFAGPEPHAHGDWLEALLDTGVLGLLALAGLLGACLLRGLRAGRADPLRLAATAGLATLLARGLVDFPLERPAELGLALVLAAVAAAGVAERAGGLTPADRRPTLER